MFPPSIMGADPMAVAQRVVSILERRRTMSAAHINERDNVQQDEGHEPDYRFTLANERTFLAWIRTALALLAGSVAIAQLVPPLAIPDARKILGGVLAIISIAIVVHSGLRWRSVQKAMRHDAPLPPSLTIWLLTGAIILIGFLVLLFVIAFGIGGA
jgi:putative membrane protein